MSEFVEVSGEEMRRMYLKLARACKRERGALPLEYVDVMNWLRNNMPEEDWQRVELELMP